MVSKKEEIAEKKRKARRIWLKNTDQETLNKIYKKISETKKLRYKEGSTVPWNKGKKRPPFSKEWRENLSKSLKGHKSSEKVRMAVILRNKTNNPMWDPKNVKKAIKNRDYKEIARKMVQTKRKNGIFEEYSKRMKENNPMKDPIINAKVNKNPEYMRKRIMALIKKPNNKEKMLIEMITKNQLPYKYVGNGELIIGSKNPDFVHKTQNKIIELFGDYWHTKKVRCYEETEEGRILFFKKHNFDTLVILEKELKDPAAVLKRIISFEREQ